ncbi:MAG: protein kinase [Acidobacteriota bacterium]
MPVSQSRQRRELLWRGLVYLPIFLLLVFQVFEAKKSSDKQIGITVEPLGEHTQIVAVKSEGPAALGGLRAGDVMLEVDGRAIRSMVDYGLAAGRFERGREVDYRIHRGGEELTLTVSPGMAIDWWPLLLNALLVAGFGSMGLLSIAKRPGSLPADLLYWLFVLAAVEIAQPFQVIGAPVLAAVTTAAAFLLAGAQFSTMLHLAGVIPEKQRWLRRRPWVIPLLYVVGFGLGTFATVTYLLEAVWQLDLLPWSFAFVRGPMNRVWLLTWAILMIAFLSLPALRHPTRQGRRQAGWVLLGALPWCLFMIVYNGLIGLGREVPAWLEVTWFWRVSLVPLPITVFIVLQMQSMIQNTLVLRLASKLQHAGSVEKISEMISRDLNLAFNTQCNYVFFRDDSNSDLTSVHSSGARVGVGNIPESFEILRLADRSGEALAFPNGLAEDLPASEAQWLRRLRAKLIVPVMATDQHLIGLLILGEKASEEPYTDHDLEIIGALTGQIALAYENIGLHFQVDEQDRVQREMLNRFEDQEIFLVKECSICGRCYDSSDETCAKDGAKLSLTLPIERNIDDRYRLDRVLGKGGVAVVYAARDMRLDRTVAVKVLARSAMDAPDASRRFEREAHIVAKLAHPRIITVHDFGKTRHGCAFLVMEYLEGSTMGQILRREGPYGPECAAELFDRVLDGLGAAHRRGIVHRDLKPDNVLISGVGDLNVGTGTACSSVEHWQEGTVKLLDFGLAKFHPRSGVENSDLTMPGFVIGTLAYMAPEQLSGEEADERSDLFAVGVMVIEALSGRKPFRGRTPGQVLSSIQKSEIEIPGNNGATGQIRDVLGRCLAYDAADRYQSAVDLRSALIPAMRSYATKLKGAPQPVS